MANDELYISEDGDLMTFQGPKPHIEQACLGETGDEVGIYLWTRLDTPAGQLIRRLLAEREEARALAREMYEGSLYDPLGWRVKYPWLTEGASD